MLASGGAAIAVSPLLTWLAQSPAEYGHVEARRGNPPDEIDGQTLSELAVAADVVVTTLGVLTVAAAVAAMLGARWPRALVTAADAACLVGSSAWAAAYSRLRDPDIGLLEYSGLLVVGLGAAALLVATTLWVAAVRHGELTSGGRASIARLALLMAGVGAPTLVLAAGVGGPSLYENVSVVDIVLTGLALLLVAAAITFRRHGLIGRAAVVVSAGLAGLALVVGLELLLTEQSVSFESDGTGALLTFVVAPIAIVGAVLLSVAIAESPRPPQPP